MSVKSGQALAIVFLTTDPITRAPADADALPTGALYVDGVADAATVTVTNITTGRYMAEVTLPTLDVGAVVSLLATATVGGVTSEAVILQDVAAEDAPSAADVAAAVVAALTSSAAFLAAVATRVWAHTARTLTQTAAQIAAVLSGTSLTIQRGDTLSITLTGLGDILARSKLYYAIKDNALGDADSAALLFLEETAGLTVVNRVPYGVKAHGSITVTDALVGNITITVKPAATALLPPGLRRDAAVEVVIAGEVSTLTQYTRTVTISADVVRATS